MMRVLHQLKRGMSMALSTLLVTCLGVLILDVLWGVVSRYLLGAQSPWTEELARLLLVWVTMLGGAFAYGEKAHLGVDLITGKLDQSARGIVELAAQSLCVLFAAYVMVWGGSQLALDRFNAEQTLSALRISRAWVYVSVPVAGVLIVAYGLESLVLLAIGGVAPPPHHQQPADR